MGEEEKKTIEILKTDIKNAEQHRKDGLVCVLRNDLQVALNLIEKQQKEINRLKDELSYTRKVVENEK